MRKAVVEFNLKSKKIKEALDITKITKTIVVNLSGEGDPYIGVEDNPHLPWVSRGIIFMHIPYESRFTVVMEK